MQRDRDCQDRPRIRPDQPAEITVRRAYDRAAGIRSNHSPHIIVIYQPALELYYGSDKARLEDEIRRTVLHELAHHLGVSHKRMKEIGLM